MRKLVFIFFFLSALHLQAQETSLSNEHGQHLVHHVFFYLKHPQSMQDKSLLKEGLKTLESIKEVKQLMIGEPASTKQREVIVSDWHVSEIIYFESIEDQDAYQIDPIHQLFVQNYSHLWERVVVYDVLLDPF